MGTRTPPIRYYSGMMFWTYNHGQDPHIGSSRPSRNRYRPEQRRQTVGPVHDPGYRQRPAASPATILRHLVSAGRLPGISRSGWTSLPGCGTSYSTTWSPPGPVPRLTRWTFRWCSSPGAGKSAPPITPAGIPAQRLPVADAMTDATIAPISDFLHLGYDATGDDRWTDDTDCHSAVCRRTCPTQTVTGDSPGKVRVWPVCSSRS